MRRNRAAQAFSFAPRYRHPPFDEEGPLRPPPGTDLVPCLHDLVAAAAFTVVLVRLQEVQKLLQVLAKAWVP